VGFLLIYFWLAPTNRWFTFVKEGTAKIVVRADGFEKALIQWKGRTFDYSKTGEDKWNVVEGSEVWHPFGGLRYYGFWPIKDIYIYNFKWSGVTENRQVVHHPKETLDYILLKDDVYWAEVNEAEDKNLLPLNVELMLTIRVVNPYRAFFNVQNWLETVINQVEPATRDILTNRDYAKWITMPAVMGDEIWKFCKKRKLLDDFRDRYGIDLRKIQVKSINPPSDYREKTLAPYLAEMDKKAIIIRADAEKERIERVFEQIQKFGDLGKLVRTLEAVEKSPLAASLTIQAIPGLQEVFRGVFGKGPEAITREEFRELREMIEKLKK
jgi:hypothetical protein